MTIADINESRLDFAESLGLQTAVSGSEALLRQQKAFDFVADATGIAAVAEAMIPLVADGGTALFSVSARRMPVSRLRLSKSSGGS